MVTVSQRVESASDEELARHAQIERGEWLEELFRRYQRRMYACAHRMLRAEEVEDAVQEISIRIMQGLPRFRGDAAIGTWLYSVARHTCLDVRRRRRAMSPLEDGEILRDGTTVGMAEGEKGDPEGTFETAIIACRTSLAINELPLSQQEVVLLRLGAGLSTKATAEALGITPDAVKARLRRARAKLRVDLSEAVMCPECGPGAYSLESGSVG
ncbi:MAG: RNA polymerase sigma factor [Acidimicrobiia bacterium]